VITEPSNILLQIVNRVARDVLRKKTQMNCQRSEKNQTRSYQEAIIFQYCHIPKLQPTWRAQKYKVKRQDWYKKYLKTDFSKLLWTDEMSDS